MSPRDVFAAGENFAPARETKKNSERTAPLPVRRAQSAPSRGDNAETVHRKKFTVTVDYLISLVYNLYITLRKNLKNTER